MVSDGSVRLILSMTYGWILATPEERWLAAANGPSMVKGNLLRTKCNRMLSVTLSASIVADEYSSETCNIKYISDNQALIRQCKEHLEFEVPYPNKTLHAEYDIIEQIYQIL